MPRGALLFCARRSVSGGEKHGQHVIDALSLGYRFGIIAGGDIHDGRPGDEMHSLQEKPEVYRLLWRQGLTGIWAKELTREAIFDALWNRRVFATTNVRIILRFSAAGHPMGSEIRQSGGIPFAVWAASEVPIARVDLVRNGVDYRCIEPHSREVNWEYIDELYEVDSWYYVRVTREDGETAWSSPIWVTPKNGDTR